MRLSTVGLTLSVGLSVQGSTVEHSGEGPGRLYVDDGPNVDFRSANRRPNATKSIDFALGDIEDGWTWRTNITSVPVPGVKQSGDQIFNRYDEPWVVNTVFDLQWSNRTANLNETIEALQDATATDDSPALPLCMTTLLLPIWPILTNKLTSENHNGDCAPVIGDGCLNAILEGYRLGSWNRTFDVLHYTCGDYPRVSELDECQPVFTHDFGAPNLEPVYISATISMFGWGAGNSTAAMNSRREGWPLHVGDATYHTTSDAYIGTNETAMMQAESKLQMILLSGPVVGDTLINQALCMRVDPSIDDLEVSDFTNATSTIEGGSTRTGPNENGQYGSQTFTSAASANFVLSGLVGLAGLLTTFSLA